MSWTITSIVHKPIRPVRDDVVGEVVFSAAWEKMATRVFNHDEEEVGVFLDLAKYHRLPDLERAARVAASFMTWLGTNCGNSFLHEASNRKGRHRYLLEWGKENRREYGINNNVRTIEFLIAPEDHFKNGALIKYPQVLFQDCEVVEMMCEWLERNNAQQMLKDCAYEIKIRHSERTRLESLAYRDMIKQL